MRCISILLFAVLGLCTVVPVHAQEQTEQAKLREEWLKQLNEVRDHMLEVAQRGGAESAMYLLHQRDIKRLDQLDLKSDAVKAWAKSQEKHYGVTESQIYEFLNLYLDNNEPEEEVKRVIDFFKQKPPSPMMLMLLYNRYRDELPYPVLSDPAIKDHFVACLTDPTGVLSQADDMAMAEIPVYWAKALEEMPYPLIKDLDRHHRLIFQVYFDSAEQYKKIELPEYEAWMLGEAVRWYRLYPKPQEAEKMMAWVMQAVEAYQQSGKKDRVVLRQIYQVPMLYIKRAYVENPEVYLKQEKDLVDRLIEIVSDWEDPDYLILLKMIQLKNTRQLSGRALRDPLDETEKVAIETLLKSGEPSEYMQERLKKYLATNSLLRWKARKSIELEKAETQRLVWYYRAQRGEVAAARELIRDLDNKHLGQLRVTLRPRTFGSWKEDQNDYKGLTGAEIYGFLKAYQTPYEKLDFKKDIKPFYDKYERYAELILLFNQNGIPIMIPENVKLEDYYAGQIKGAMHALKLSQEGLTLLGRAERQRRVYSALGDNIQYPVRKNDWYFWEIMKKLCSQASYEYGELGITHQQIFFAIEAMKYVGMERFIKRDEEFLVRSTSAVFKLMEQHKHYDVNDMATMRSVWMSFLALKYSEDQNTRRKAQDQKLDELRKWLDGQVLIHQKTRQQPEGSRKWSKDLTPQHILAHHDFYVWELIRIRAGLNESHPITDKDRIFLQDIKKQVGYRAPLLSLKLKRYLESEN